MPQSGREIQCDRRKKRENETKIRPVHQTVAHYEATSPKSLKTRLIQTHQKVGRANILAWSM